MKRAQVQLLELLVAVMYQNKIEDLTKRDWKGIVDEAVAHQIKGLVYPVLGKTVQEQCMEASLLEDWKRTTFLTGISQVRHMMQVGVILKHLSEMSIPVIALKGLVVREYYPRPELRTMCDADLLVKEADLQKVERFLLEQGYTAVEASPVHIKYVHPHHYAVEVHWTIRDERVFEACDMLEEGLWAEAQPTYVGGAAALSLGLEDLMIHLCAHMATHLSVGGFGIRQVFDLAMLLRAEVHQINWGRFVEKAKAWQLEQFVATLFCVIEQLFQMPYPQGLRELGSVRPKTVQHLIDDIWESGVHGKREKVQILANELAKDVAHGKKSHEASVIGNFLRFLFPPVEALSDTYGYVKQHHWLLPIGWLHHGWNGLCGKEYSVWDKLKFTLTALSVSKKRNRLLRALEL